MIFPVLKIFLVNFFLYFENDILKCKNIPE